jgi:hypothetical protein
MADRVCIVEVVEPESGLMKAFAREEEDWELGISLPRPPAGDASSAGEDSRQPPAGARTSSFPERVPTLIASDCFASPGQIFATCKENRLAHFLLTDTREFVFGEIQMAPALRRNFDDPLGISSVGRGRVVGVETGAQTTADFGQAGPRGSDGVLLVKFRPLACFANDSPVGFLSAPLARPVTWLTRRWTVLPLTSAGSRCTSRSRSSRASVRVVLLRRPSSSCS